MDLQKPGVHASKKVVVNYKGRIEKTPSGVLCGGGSSFAFVDPRVHSLVKPWFVSPIQLYTMDCPHQVTSYAILLSSLIKRYEVEAFTGNYAH
jgi:hypothetical protein